MVIRTEKRTICSAVRAGWPGLGPDTGDYFIQHYDTYCSCLKTARYYAQVPDLSIYYVDGEVSSSVSTVIMDTLLHLDEVRFVYNVAMIWIADFKV